MALPTREQLSHPDIVRMIRASIAERLSGPMCGLTDRFFPQIAIGTDRPVSAPRWVARQDEAA